MTAINVCDINAIDSEAGVVASALLHPDFVWMSEQLKPSHFTNIQNAYLYHALRQLARQKITQVDKFIIRNVLTTNQSTRKDADKVLPIEAVQDFIDNAAYIARDTAEGYQKLANDVLRAAMRRDTYQKLTECQRLCLDFDEENIEQKIYSAIDGVMTEFSTTKNVPQYKDVIDELWAEIQERQDNGMAGVPFKFPTLNQYATIEPGELFIFAAEAKQGKSMILLNEAVDLLMKDLSVMYIDSELNSRMFTCRILAHLSNIEFNRLKSGRYTKEEGQRIQQCVQWLKSKRFTHLYMPMFDAQSIYTEVKKVMHTQGIDVLIVDYFKGKGDSDAFASYQELGRLTDLVKNRICGEMNIAGIGAAQANQPER